MVESVNRILPFILFGSLNAVYSIKSASVLDGTKCFHDFGQDRYFK